MRKILLSLALFIPGLLSSQTIIQGFVKDLTTNEPLIGAFITIKGTSLATVSDETGNYQIITPAVSEAKTFVLIVNHLGFKEKYQAIDVLPIDDGESIIRNFEVEPDPLTLKDVTVTANKVEEELQQVPIAATVIDAANMTKRTVTSTEEAFAIVPNLVTDAFLPSRATFSLRGLASDFSNVGIENSVGLYIDDVYYSRSHNFNSTLFDIERVEVLRGPQGTLFGKNTIGGVLHVISEKPKMGNSAALEINAGTYRYLQARGKINRELIKNKLALRVSGAYRQRDGWLKQESEQVSDKNGIRFYGGRAALLFTPNEKVDILLQGTYSKDDKADFSEDYKTPDDVVDLLRVNSVERDNEDRKAYENETDRQFNRDIYGAIGKLDIKLGRVHKLTSISAVNGYSSTYARDLDASSVNAVFSANSSSLKNFSQEIRIGTPRENRKFFYVLGAYFLRENLENRDSIAFKEGMIPVWKNLTGNPSYPLPDNYFESAALEGNITSTSYAGFLSTSLEVTQRVRINAGIRFTREEKKIVFLQTVNSPFNLVTKYVATPAGRPGDPFNRNSLDNVFSGNFGMDFKTSDNILLYFSVSRGFKGSGFNLAFTPDVNVEKLAFKFKPEFINSYEVGVKLKASNRYLFNAAVFVTDFRDKQEVVTAGSSVFVANAESVQGQGAEGEFTGIWTKFFRTDLAIGLLNITYQDFPFIAPFPIRLDDGTIVAPLETINLSGNTALKAPNLTFKVSPELHFPLGKELKVLLRLDYDYIGDVPNDIFNTPSLYRKAAGFWNGRLSFSTVNERFSVSLWGKNLSNETVIQHGWKYTWGEVVSVNPPRMVGIELRTNFF